jgi:hypothetical protein
VSSCLHDGKGVAREGEVEQQGRLVYGCLCSREESKVLLVSR